MAVCLSAAFIAEEIRHWVSLFRGSDTASLHWIVFIITCTQDSVIRVVKSKNQIVIIPSLSDM